MFGSKLCVMLTGTDDSVVVLTANLVSGQLCRPAAKCSSERESYKSLKNTLLPHSTHTLAHTHTYRDIHKNAVRDHICFISHTTWIYAQPANTNRKRQVENSDLSFLSDNLQTLRFKLYLHIKLQIQSLFCPLDPSPGLCCRRKFLFLKRNILPEIHISREIKCFFAIPQAQKPCESHTYQNCFEVDFKAQQHIYPTVLRNVSKGGRIVPSKPRWMWKKQSRGTYSSVFSLKPVSLW